MKDTAKEVSGEDKLFNFRPAFFAAVFLALGIVFYFYYHFQGVSALWVLCLLPLAVMPFFFCRTREKLWKTACAVLLLGCSFFLGFFSFGAQVGHFEDRKAYHEMCYVTGRVVEIREYDNFAALVLDDVWVEKESIKDKVIAYMPASFCEKVNLSDEVFLRATLETVEVNAEEFGLMAGEFGDKIFYRAWMPAGSVTGHKFDLTLFLYARAENAIDYGMDKTSAAVTKAVLLGNTYGIDDGLYENIRRGGIAHIFAVSGLHVGALFGFCLLLTKNTAMRRLSKVAQFFFTACILLLYAALCGFAASVVRATVLCLFGYVAKLFKVKSDLLEALGCGGICILLCTPSALFEVGFQLSFAACFGIVFLTKPIGQVCDEMAKTVRGVFPRKLTAAEIEAIKNDDTLPPRISTRIYRAVTSFVSVSLAAQIFTAPLLLYYFGYVSGWALLLNCLFVPLISAMFSILLMFVVLASLLPVELAAVILYVPKVVWSALLLLFEAVDFSGFSIENVKITAAACLPYFAACTLISDKWNLEKILKYAFTIACILAFGITMVALNV